MFTFSKPTPLSFLDSYSVLHLSLLSLSLSFSSNRDSFHYCSQSGPSGQLLCSTVHLNIILLIKGLPPHHRCPAPASALFSHWSQPFVHPGTHPLASCQATLLPFEKRRRHLCLYPFHVALISAAILQTVFCACVRVYVWVCGHACVPVCLCACVCEPESDCCCLCVRFIQLRAHQG